MFRLTTTLRSTAPFARRSLTTSRVSCKTVTDTVKDAAQTLNKAASSAALGAIETGEKVSETVAQTTKPLTDQVKQVRPSARHIFLPAHDIS